MERGPTRLSTTMANSGTGDRSGRSWQRKKISRRPKGRKAKTWQVDTNLLGSHCPLPSVRGPWQLSWTKQVGRAACAGTNISGAHCLQFHRWSWPMIGHSCEKVPGLARLPTVFPVVPPQNLYYLGHPSWPSCMYPSAVLLPCDMLQVRNTTLDAPENTAMTLCGLILALFSPMSTAVFWS